MILEMSIRNFRSIGEEQTLSFCSSDANGSKCVAFYGANASGKTNLLRALWSLRMIISSSYRLGEGESIPWYDACIFYNGEGAPGTGAYGNRFDIEFTVPGSGGGGRYAYTLEYDSEEIVFESLSSFAKRRRAMLFTRKRGDDKDSMAFGSSMRGGERKMAFFKNQAYLSVAGRNPAAPDFIRSIYRYFKVGMTQMRLNDDNVSFYDPQSIEAQKLIRFVDLGISEMSIRNIDVDPAIVPLPEAMPQPMREKVLESIRNRYYFTHDAGNGVSGEIELKNESDGTQRLFKLLPNLVKTLAEGGVLIIDEIESGMHPFMAETIVKLFNDSCVNRGEAQLLFTTHNTNLLSSSLMRREQIWFVEKIGGCSRFYSLDDFDKKKVTPSSPFSRWYMEGRFGALPAIDYAGLASAIKAIQMRADDEKPYEA